MLIIAAITGVCIKVTKAKLNNIISYTYYSTYSTLQSVTTSMLVDYNPDDEMYQAKNNNLFNKFKQYLAVLINIPPASADTGTHVIYACEDVFYYEFGDSVAGVPYYFPHYKKCMPYGYPLIYEQFKKGNYINCPGKINDASYMYPFSQIKNLSTYEINWTNIPLEELKCFYSCDGSGNVQGNCGNMSDFYHLGCEKYTYDLRDFEPEYNYKHAFSPEEEQKYIKATSHFNYTLKSSTLLDNGVCKYEIQCDRDYRWKDTGSIDGFSTGKCEKYQTSCPEGRVVGPYESCELPEPEPDPEPTPEPEPEPEPVPPPCNVSPSANEVQEQYCKGKEFNNTPGVCTWVDKHPWPPVCESGQEWNVDECKCTPMPPTIPKKGMNFCKLFEQLANIAPIGNVCQGDTIAEGTTDFASLTPDLILRNGVRLYNLHKNPDLIPELRTSGIDDATARKDMKQQGYIIYADIDGQKGDSTLWEDVYPFYVTLSGRVIPAYDKTLNPDGLGGDSNKHLEVSVKNEIISNDGHRIFAWLSKSVPFQVGACQAGIVYETTPYCSGVEYNSVCSLVKSNCQLKILKPVKFF